ncbi:AraC family transcriptional regulator [Flammeovirgaceae bacterium SG7u.111]|nr:AraC family transcriptional regulator [Flammeovirgaceae bacterium SG7u.132]WPO36697.1 AraC family transcriptional regulator [Flammeovirgaceae bacterium SG7u.111]
MKIISLPAELTVDDSSPITIYDYNSSQEISKQQIILTKNTFSFLVKGTKEVIMDNSSLAINNAEFLLMKAGHCLMTEKLSNSDQHYRSILLFFSNEAVLQFIRKFELRPVAKPKPQSVQSFSYDAFINGFIKSLIDITRLPQKTQRKLMELKFEEIMLYLVETKGADFLFSITTFTDNQTQHFINVVENNKLNKLTLKELAFLANMSISSFKREFQKCYAEPPIKWFQDRRLEYASYLLKQEKRRPSDIYLEIGYENLSSFIQAFKIKFGVTPKQYREHLSF